MGPPAGQLLWFSQLPQWESKRGVALLLLLWLVCYWATLLSNIWESIKHMKNSGEITSSRAYWIENTEQPRQEAFLHFSSSCSIAIGNSGHWYDQAWSELMGYLLGSRINNVSFWFLQKWEKRRMFGRTRKQFFFYSLKTQNKPIILYLMQQEFGKLTRNLLHGNICNWCLSKVSYLREAMQIWKDPPLWFPAGCPTWLWWSVRQWVISA